MNTALLIQLLDAGLAITTLLSSAGINYREVMDAQEAAKANGEAFDPTPFIDQAQAKVDSL